MSKNGKSQFAILGILAILKKSSGYDLKKHMESSTQYFWKESFSSIYPVLEDLEKQNLIVKIDAPTRSLRNRTPYTLTPAGEKALKDWLIQTPENMQLRNELLLKLFFGNFVSIDVSIAHLENYHQELLTKLATFNEIKKELQHSDTLENLYSLITIDHGIRLTAASLEWCNQAIRTLKSVGCKN